MYILADIKEIVKIQYLYRNKDDFRFFQIQKISFFNVKDFIFNIINISVKYIFWQIYKEIVEIQDFYRNKDDF